MRRLTTMTLILLAVSVPALAAQGHDNGSEMAIWVLLGLFGLIILLQWLQSRSNRKHH